MKDGRMQTNLEYATARLLLSGLGLLPRQVAVGIGCMMGKAAYRVSRKLRQTGERNLELAFPTLDSRERERILRGCFISLGRQLGEVSKFSGMRNRDLSDVIECEGLENLTTAHAGGRGVILFTGHLGAWELSSLTLSLLGYPLNFLVRRIDNPKVEQLLDQTRTRFGNGTIDKRNAMRPALRSLRAGGILGLLVDVNMVSQEGIFVDFFGKAASTTFMLAKLALRTNAPVLPVFAPWNAKRNRFLLHIGEPLTVERSGNEAEDVRTLTSHFTKVIEDYIRRYPDQWLWIHKRWRTRPAGEVDLYQNGTRHSVTAIHPL